MPNTDGSPHIDEVDISTYLNVGPYMDQYNADNFFREDNIFGKPISMEIHSSIESMYRYGKISFEDTAGVRESLPLTGGEILTVLYKNTITGDSPQQFTGRVIHFNIFDMTEEQVRPTSSKQERFTRKKIVFHVIEAPFYLKYNGQPFLRSFGKDFGDGITEAPRIDEIFTDIFTNNLKMNTDFIEYDFHKMSKNIYPFTMPHWKPQKFFKYLLEYARDENDYGNVKLFTSSNPETGFIKLNLKSILGMYKNPNRGYIHEYSLTDEGSLENSIANQNISVRRNLNQIYYYNFLTYDLTSLTTGLPGAGLSNYNYINGGYFIQYDDYRNSNLRNPYFQNYGLWNEDISNRFNTGFYKGPLPEQTGKDFLNNRIIDDNYQIRCEALCMVNEEIEVGDVIYLPFLSSMVQFSEGQSQLLDVQMSGAWLIQDMVDIVNYGKGYRKYTLIKDSFFDIYSPSAGNQKSRLPDIKNVATET